MALLKSKHQAPEWQAATKRGTRNSFRDDPCLSPLWLAEDRGPFMHALVGMMLALHGAMPIPEYDPSKVKCE